VKKTSQRLQTVLKLAKLKQQLAAQQLGKMLQNVDAQQQVEQLKHYQQDYAAHFKVHGAQGTDANQLINFQRFMDNLQQVIVTQQERTVLAEAQREQARSRWQQQYRRSKNLEALVERKQQAEERVEENKRQRTQDDRRPSRPLD
jgi:flagellar export protein FliJ